jgi:23S rRNA (uracil1939-C5)-methyltransferase
LQISIEKLIYGGDGLGHLPADASGRQKAVFVPFVLTGETVEASTREAKAGFVRAQLEKVIESSPKRIEPACPYFSRCGGCQYQHAEYDHQLEIKKEILRETLRRTAKIELPVEIQVHPSPPWNYRNRSRLQVRSGPDFACGYFKLASHELLAIEQCPISSPLINRGIALLWESGRAGKVPHGVREVEFFSNANDSELLIEVSCTNEVRRAAARSWTEDLRSSMPEIIGAVAFRETSPATRHAPEKFLTSGVDHLTYITQRKSYRVTAGSFFQTNRYLIDELVGIVVAGQSGELALDFYAGVGLFSTALASDIHHIVSVESSQTSSADLSYNQTSNGEAVQATTEQYLARLEDSGRVGKGKVLPHNFHRPDLAVVDPPRSGLGERVARMLVTLGAPRVVYVSCDPSTLARDMAVLLKGGYRLEQVHLVDLFPHTFHLETVVHLAR